jgi:hypothetical protein
MAGVDARGIVWIVEMLRKLVTIAALSLTLAGCGTTAKQIDQICRGYGFRPGTEGFANCRMQVDQQYLNPTPSYCSVAPSPQPVERRLGVLQDRCIEALGEPVVDGREEIHGLPHANIAFETQACRWRRNLPLAGSLIRAGRAFDRSSANAGRGGTELGKQCPEHALRIDQDHSVALVARFRVTTAVPPLRTGRDAHRNPSWFERAQGH